MTIWRQDISGPLNAPVIDGIHVNRIGVGCANFTGPGVWGEPENRDECVSLLRRAVDLGVNLFDTADSYGPFVSEEIVRTALHPYPNDVIVGTKIGQVHFKPSFPGDDRWASIGRPEYLRFALEMSLRRLGTDHIRLVHLHRPDPQVPFDEQVGAMKEFQNEGKIGHIGLSNVSVEQLDQARRIAEIVSVENRFNLLEQEEVPMLVRCEELGLPFFPYFPLGLGRIIVDGGPLDELASRTGVTKAQLALAWLLHRSPAFVPIPGPTTVAQLEEDLQAINVSLDEETFRAITASSV